MIPLVPRHGVGAGSSEVCLERGPNSDKGADLKYRCEMVCGAQRKVMHGSNSSNIKSMKPSDTETGSGREKECGI